MSMFALQGSMSELNMVAVAVLICISALLPKLSAQGTVSL